MGTAGPPRPPATSTRTDAHPVRRWSDRARRALRRAVGSAPLTFGYIALLAGTTAVLGFAPASVAQRLLTSSSTDVAHLSRDPIVVLIASAGWLPGLIWLPYAVVLILVAAPLERRVGSLRTALVFWSAHIMATLLTELPIAVAISRGWLPATAAYRLDVGASYGTLALVAAFAGGLPRRWGLLLLAVALALVTGVPTAPPDLSTFGHALSLVIGVCWWPTLYGRVPWRRRLRTDPGRGLGRPPAPGA